MGDHDGQIYGTTAERAAAIRKGSGGQLRVATLPGIGVAPPVNNLPNAPPMDNDRAQYPDASMFLTGGRLLVVWWRDH